MKIIRTVLAALLFLVSPGINSYEALAQMQRVAPAPTRLSRDTYEMSMQTLRYRESFIKRTPTYIQKDYSSKIKIQRPAEPTKAPVQSKSVPPVPKTAPLEAALGGMEKSLEGKLKTVSNSVSTDAEASGATRDMAEILQGATPAESAADGAISAENKGAVHPSSTLKPSSRNLKSAGKSALAAGGLLLYATQASAAETTATTVAELTSQGFAWASAHIFPLTNGAAISAFGLFATIIATSRLRSKLQKMALGRHYRPDEKNLAINLTSLAVGSVLFSATAKLAGMAPGETLAAAGAGAVAFNYLLTKAGLFSEDMKAWLSMALYSRFETGDKIAFELPDGKPLEGRVKEITPRDTVLTVAKDGKKVTVLVPNTHMTKAGLIVTIAEKWYMSPEYKKNKRQKDQKKVSDKETSAIKAIQGRQRPWES